MIWVGPDGHRYRVTLLREPFDADQQSIVFQADGWTGAAAAHSEDSLLDLLAEDLARLLARAVANEYRAG